MDDQAVPSSPPADGAALGVVLGGTVVRGDGRGRELGYPTANLELDDAEALPADGVYAGSVQLADGRRFKAALSIGTRPTYYGRQGQRVVEAYLLDFEADLYGERVLVGVGECLRGQRRFESNEDLVAEMARDVERVRAAGELRLPGG